MMFNPFFDKLPEDHIQFSLASVSFVEKGGWLTITNKKEHKAKNLPPWQESPWIYTIIENQLFGCHFTQQRLKPLRKTPQEYFEEHKNFQLERLSIYGYSVNDVNQ